MIFIYFFWCSITAHRGYYAFRSCVSSAHLEVEAKTLNSECFGISRKVTTHSIVCFEHTVAIEIINSNFCKLNMSHTRPYLSLIHLNRVLLQIISNKRGLSQLYTDAYKCHNYDSQWESTRGYLSMFIIFKLNEDSSGEH